MLDARSIGMALLSTVLSELIRISQVDNRAKPG
jgi:hypothetical protein